MFSRYWYLALGAVTAAALACAYIVHASMVRTTATATEQALSRDRFEVELWMSLDDYARISAIAPMTTNGEVRTAVTAANARAAGTTLAAGIRQDLEATLQQLNQQLADGRADVLVALDRGGMILGQVGGGAPASDASLRELDLVRACLDGEPKAGIWMRDGTPLRAAARPIFVNGTVAGVIIHAMEIDDDLASRLASHVEGSSIAFFYGDRVIADATADGTGASTGRETIQALLPAARARPELRQTGRNPATAIGESARAIVALFPGQPVEGQLGFVVARPIATDSSPFAMLAHAPSNDIASLPWALVLGLPLLLALAGVAFLVVEKERPLAAFSQDLRKFADGSAPKLDSSRHTRGFRLLAEDVNAGVERALLAVQSEQRRSQSLDALLGAPAAGSSAPGFAGGEVTAPFATGGRPTTPERPKDRPQAQPAPAATPASPPAAPPAPPPAAPTTAAAVPRASLATSQPISLPPDSSSFSDDDDESATTVAQIPAELLSTLQSDQSEEDSHFRETYDEYIRVREQCNESTKGLTFEKFVLTLRKTKEQILQKHGGSRVRFTVYVKEGKAALKASPR